MMIDFESKISQGIISERASRHLQDLLEGVWKKRFGDIDFFCGYDRYSVKDKEVILALEHLRQLNLIPTTKVIDESGRVYPNSSLTEWQQLFRNGDQRGIFTDINVGVVGGPEAEIFAAMGADAIGIDPLLSKLPPHGRINLLEIPLYLDTKLAESLRERFDITYTSWVFDDGNDLVPFMGLGPYHTEAGLIHYAKYLKLILSMTKRDGLSIHNGNRVLESLQYLPLGSASVLEIARPFGDFRPGHSINIKVLQKLA